MTRGRFTPFLHDLNHEHGAGKGKGEGNDQTGVDIQSQARHEPADKAEESQHQQLGDQHMAQRRAPDPRFQEVPDLQFQTDAEKQQGDARLGEYIEHRAAGDAQFVQDESRREVADQRRHTDRTASHPAEQGHQYQQGIRRHRRPDRPGARRLMREPWPRAPGPG